MAARISIASLLRLAGNIKKIRNIKNVRLIYKCMDRERLISLAIKYSGDYKRVYQALKDDEICDIKDDVQALTILDEAYPKAFFDLSLPPLVLFYHGDISLLHTRCVSVIGSRDACEYAKRATRDLCDVLKREYTIVSGLAKGIDAIAHLSAIDQKTIGVIGCGIDRVYPFCNSKLYAIMAQRHLIISEYPGCTRPYASHFPFRNRLIAALGEKMYVMQASMKSGTFSSVNEALELNRDVYALPYPIYDPNGEGTNHLIAEGANMIAKDDISSY